MSLARLRNQINEVDRSIVRQLNRRAAIIGEIGKFKMKTGKMVYSPGREVEVFANLMKYNQGPLPQKSLKAIYREIMSASFAIEKGLSVAFLGPEATFTQLAAMKKFGSQVNYTACNTIADIFLEVERGNVDYGVVPIENSIEGAVTHTLDMLVDSDLRICSQVTLPISHNLLRRISSIKGIKRVYSNPQVFGQCRLWLNRNLAESELIEVSSTTTAAKLAAKDKSSAAIASFLAAKVYKLHLAASEIEDSPHNITRFLVIGNHDAEPTRKDRTSIVFSIKDRVGALHDMLMPFKKYRINMSKIESRPSKKRAWDYYFFVDLEGHCSSKPMSKALSELESKCKFFKVLGAYPATE